ncbi:class I SAM-dependent methyltransferase [Actinoplanes sp. LDG1-06]|uniref:Class I SAM-dependent methyltransferase n=1 Tax=Paractinoplanes ovalisporus TaxID=2810368 RepID=A0ABS2A804_9ACTN|nr:class I SAM-dependent methyltransferase [Actinoplanes ovalisporus]MBM2615967.1 class I SAM-dependent methyltransferase [Actinoplanes ovalisporus]
MTTLIGGEMLLWSDLDGSHGPAPAQGDALRSLTSKACGRTLVAGPHAPSLLPAGDVTVLIRGAEDAPAYATHPGVTVLCGSLEKLSGSYDTVIALDGLDRLHSAEAPPFSWDETLTQLRAVLAPGGRLLLGMENLFGVHRLAARPTPPADTDWTVPDDRDPHRPAGHARLLARLESAGLDITHDYAAYPSLSSPSVLLGRTALNSPSGALSAAIAAAFPRVAASDPAALIDPVRLASTACRNGLTVELAPAWIVVATSGEATTSSFPELVINAEPVTVSSLPQGRTLEDHLLAAAQRRDLPAMRALLTTWQSGPSAGVPADRVVLTSVQESSGALVPLASPGDPLKALRAFASTAIAGGYAHLWPIQADETELTAVLAGMTGRELDPAEVPPADHPATPSTADLLSDRERLTRELSEAKAKHEWYEKMLLHREAEVKRVRQMNALLSATAPGRAATSLVGGLRAGKRAVRAVVRRTRGN